MHENVPASFRARHEQTGAGTLFRGRFVPRLETETGAGAISCRRYFSTFLAFRLYIRGLGGRKFGDGSCPTLQTTEWA